MDPNDKNETAGAIVALVALIVFALLSVSVWLSAFPVTSKLVLEAVLVALIGIGWAWIVKAS